MALNGTGTKIEFGTSDFTADMLSINVNGISREARNVSHLETTDWHEFDPGDLTDPGEVSIAFQYDPDEQPPINEPKETITITYPTPSGGASGATHAGEGFLTNFEITAELETTIEATATLKRSGEWTFTASS